MAKLTFPQLEKLLRQSQKYAPAKQRNIQMDACETLLRLIRPGQAYPFEFICFHLTGYRPKTSAKSELISHAQLLADLPLYIEILSRVEPCSAQDFGQKIYTVEMLAKRFRVSSKTIQRWRRQGLPGRYMRFGDGRLRLGFPASSVDYFVRQNRAKVNRGKVFSQISASEVTAIQRRLKRFARAYPEQRQQALQRCERKFKRSFESVRRILLDLETEEGTLFHLRAPRLSGDEQKQIYDLYRQGVSVDDLSQRFGRSRTNIYDAVSACRKNETQQLEIAYIHNQDFERKENCDRFLIMPANLFEEQASDSPGEVLRKTPLRDYQRPFDKHAEEPKTASEPMGPLDTYVNDICKTKLLNARQEAFLFRKYNFLKYQAKCLQEAITQRTQVSGLLRELRGKLKEANALKHWLIQANLRLVVSTARQHTRNPSQMMELISEGNIALMNAVEKFDYSRGFKFSTYATWAMVKRFASYHTQLQRQHERYAGEVLYEVTADLRVMESNVLAVESARKSLKEVMDETLEEREQVIVREHYGLGEQAEMPLQRKAKSFNQIGQLIGLSKERVRQIELVALQKLRRVLSGEQFERLLHTT